MDWLIGICVGFVAALVVVWLWRRGGSGDGGKTEIRHSIMQLRSVGELVVFRLITQQIVTAEQHIAGAWKDWVKWLLSSKKMAVIIEYGIDFKYDLQDPAFEINCQGPDQCRMLLPPCRYQTNIRDIKFYDEQNARWLPWLLGDMTEALGPGFDESDKNKLLDAARAEADDKAQLMVEQLANEAKSSARHTLEAMARGFGVDKVDIEFADVKAQPTGQTTVAIETESQTTNQ